MDADNWSSRWGTPFSVERSNEDPINHIISRQQHRIMDEFELPSFGATYTTLPAAFPFMRNYVNDTLPPDSYFSEQSPHRTGNVNSSPQPVKHRVIRSPRSEAFGPRTRPTPAASDPESEDHVTVNANATHSGTSLSHRIPIIHQTEQPVATPLAEQNVQPTDARGPSTPEPSTANDTPRNSADPPQEVSPCVDRFPQSLPLTPIASHQIDKALKELQSIRLEVDAFTSTTKDKQYLYLEDKLDKLLLSIDQIDSAGEEGIRQRRRQITKDVLSAITLLESKLNSTTSPSEATDACDNGYSVSESVAGDSVGQEIE